MINLHEDIKGNAKCINLGGLGKVTGYPGSPMMSAFNKAHATSFSTLIETMRQSCTVIASYLSKVAYINLSHLHLAPPLGCSVLISPRYLAPENYCPWAIVRCCLRDPTLSHFSRTPTWDRQTDGHTTTAYSVSTASRGKNC